MVILSTDEFETGAATPQQDEVKPTVKVVMSPEAAAAAAAAAQDAETADEEDDITVEVRNNSSNGLLHFATRRWIDRVINIVMR